MPELPEVEVVRRGLADHVVGRHIRAASFLHPRVARRHVAGPADLADRLQDNLIQAAERRGKYLWLSLVAPDSHRQALVIHLGMSGQLLIESPAAPPEKHLHATLDFTESDGRGVPPPGRPPRCSPAPQLRFVDQRTFGGMALAELVPDLASATSPRPLGVPSPIAHIAPDPLEAAYDQRAVVRRMKARHSGVKRALLDQGLVSGVGNIYADEALWRAQVHGEREAAALTRPALSRVLDHAREVMTEALAQGGTSFDALYVDVNGASGYFSRLLNVYGMEGDPCARCGTPIRREQFMNRSSYSCPRCQPRPRVRAARSR